MKQKPGYSYFLFPEAKPRTLLGLHKWHLQLLEDCVLWEFEKRALQAGISKLNEEIRKYVEWSEEDAYRESATWALKHLNKLKSEWEEKLRIARDIVRVIHDTNEMILANLMRAQKQGKILHRFEPRHIRSESDMCQPGSNLLHEPGWLSELSTANKMQGKRSVCFMTFGTIMDSMGVDMVIVQSPRRRIKWKNYPWRGQGKSK